MAELGLGLPTHVCNIVVERNTMVLQEPNSELRYESLSVSASEVEAAIHELAGREV
jgi:acyl CoA:acetate/3-ketoacid CoA transferase beta subunit